MPGGSSVRSFLKRRLKESNKKKMKLIKYSELAQSHVSLPTTATRALMSTLRTTKLHCQNATKSDKLIYRAEALSRCISLG